MLFGRLKAFSLQGLLINDNYCFSAAIEAIIPEADDNKTLFPYKNIEVVYPFLDRTTEIPFSQEELRAKCILASEIGIPFFIICYINQRFDILQAFDRKGDVLIRKSQHFTEEEFIEWWRNLKGTIQNKQLSNGGEARLSSTIFDMVLRRHGLEWGGNVDGFAMSKDGNSVRFIIDNISVSKPNLSDDPSNYFNSPNPKHGPRYEGWYATVKLANQLKVPHVLFTFDKNNDRLEHIGFTVIDKLTPNGVFYVDNVKANNNIINGIDSIVNSVNTRVAISDPPKIIEKAHK